MLASYWNFIIDVVDIEETFKVLFRMFANTGFGSRNNVPNKTLLVETFVCAVVGTLRSTFCVPDTVLDVPDIIWNILPNNIWHIFLISDFCS